MAKPNYVPGVLVLVYEGATSIEVLPSSPSYAMTAEATALDTIHGLAQGSNVVRMLFIDPSKKQGTYQALGGIASSLQARETVVPPNALITGADGPFDARFLVEGTSDFPLQVLRKLTTDTTPLEIEDMFHNLLEHGPIIDRVIQDFGPVSGDNVV